jgi:hypothetical protein
MKRWRRSSDQTYGPHRCDGCGARSDQRSQGPSASMRRSRPKLGHPHQGVAQVPRRQGRDRLRHREQVSTDFSCFELATCHLKTEQGLRLIAISAEGGNDLPPEAIGDPEIVASGDGIVVQVAIDPTKLDAGAYATKWQLGGVPIFTSSFKTKITRSFANSALPTAVVSLGGLIGFAVAIAGAFAAARATGGNWTWNLQTIIALVFGAGLAAGAAFQVFLTQYADATVWLPTVGNYGKLGLAAGAAAAGGGVAGQLAKLFSPSSPPPG